MMGLRPRHCNLMLVFRLGHSNFFLSLASAGGLVFRIHFEKKKKKNMLSDFLCFYIRCEILTFYILS